MSDHQGIQDQDPAERLAAALRRIAVGIERREASAAAAQGTLESALETARGAASEAEGVFQRPIQAEGTEVPVAAANLDALIARLRAVLDNPDGS